MWQPQVERLADYHLLIPDLPGHGDSTGIRLTSIADAANRIAELIREQAHGGKAHVVGLSLGAQVAVYLLAQSPELVDHAVISSALLQTDGPQWLYHPGFLAIALPLSVMPYRNSRWWARVNMKYSGGIPEDISPNFSRLFNKIDRRAVRGYDPGWLEQSHSGRIVTCSKSNPGPVRAEGISRDAGIDPCHCPVITEWKSLSSDLPERCPPARTAQLVDDLPRPIHRTVKAWIDERPPPLEV